MELEQTWNLIELLNDDANSQCKNLWKYGQINDAVCKQTQCFRENLSNLNNEQLDSIKYWLQRDTEFCDYFNCLSNNMIIDFVGKDSM